MTFTKIVVVLIKEDAQGKVEVGECSQPPHGYHHILGIYEDKGFWSLAHVWCNTSEAEVREIAKMLAGDLPVEVDIDFYKKYFQK